MALDQPRKRRRIEPDPAWGTSNFDGCDFCRRSRSCENPVCSLRASKPKLGFRSDRHAECNMCWSAMRNARPAETSGNQKNKYNDSLTEPAQYDEHCALVENY